MRTRFAPSPTGWLHLGHAHAAREAFTYATQHSGECWLRVEDTDHTRCKTKFTNALYADLDWLGFDWPLPVRVQSQNYKDYAETVADLIRRDLAYPCLLTRSEIKSGQGPIAHKYPFDKDGIIHTLKESAKSATPALPFAIRLNLKAALSATTKTLLSFQETGPMHTGLYNAYDTLSGLIDPIIARKDIGCSYMVAGPQDDAVQGMTHIIRGADLFDETPLQVLMQVLMGWPRPTYHHHRLILAETGEKLSKRNLDTALKGLREAGQRPTDIWDLI